MLFAVDAGADGLFTAGGSVVTADAGLYVIRICLAEALPLFVMVMFTAPGATPSRLSDSDRACDNCCSKPAPFCADAAEDPGCMLNGLGAIVSRVDVTKLTASAKKLKHACGLCRPVEKQADFPRRTWPPPAHYVVSVRKLSAE